MDGMSGEIMVILTVGARDDDPVIIRYHNPHTAMIINAVFLGFVAEFCIVAKFFGG
jgi:hypothetical protein